MAAPGASIPRQVPFQSWDEWDSVRRSLFSSVPEEQWAGVCRVSGWRSRGRVSIFIDITAALVEALSARNPVPSEYQRRLLVAMCLTRLVNFVAEPLQKGQYAGSVARLAQQAGLPRVLVDLRHESTHQELPSWPALEQGARCALEWLGATYWTKQALEYRKETLKAALREVKGVQNARLKLRGGRERGNEEMHGEDSVKRQRVTGPGLSVDQLRSTSANAVQRILTLLSPSGVEEALIPLLTDDDFLIPHTVPLSQRREEGGRGGKEGGLGAPPNVGVWGDVLDRFSRAWPDFYPALFKALLDRLVRRGGRMNPTQIQCGRSWGLHLLSRFPSLAPVLLHHTLRSPHPATRPLFDWVCQHRSDEEGRRDLERVYAAREHVEGARVGGGRTNDGGREWTRIGQHDEQMNNGPWRFAEGWSEAPMGQLPGWRVPVLDLPIEMDDDGGMCEGAEHAQPQAPLFPTISPSSSVLASPTPSSPPLSSSPPLRGRVLSEREIQDMQEHMVKWMKEQC